MRPVAAIIEDYFLRSSNEKITKWCGGFEPLRNPTIRSIVETKQNGFINSSIKSLSFTKAVEKPVPQTLKKFQQAELQHK